MKKSEKRMMLILIIVGIIIITVLVNVKNKKNETNIVENPVQEEGTPVVEDGQFVQKVEEGKRVNTSEKLAETKTFSNYEVSNIKLTEQNGESILVADVKNTGKAKADAVIVDIIILDEYENEILKYNTTIGEVEPGETVPLNAAATADLANAYDFKIQISEEQ